MKANGFLITCEHGGNHVPVAYRRLFTTQESKQWLGSHRGYDLGALPAAKQFSKTLRAPLVCSTTTRLLVDLNRSKDNSGLFSKFSGLLDTSQREKLLRQYYDPYRENVTQRIESMLAESMFVIHLSIHTFTPRFHGRWRPMEVGLLFDPASRTESRICHAWRNAMEASHCRARVQLNQPYLGTDDGLTTALRKRFPSSGYAGIEVEINHRLYKHDHAKYRALVTLLLRTCLDAVDQSS